MCYTIEINLTREQLEKRFGVKFPEKEDFNPKRRLSAFSFPTVPVICSEKPEYFRNSLWGLIPSWIKTEKDALSIRTKTFNAVSETISKKTSFGSVFGYKHCIIPVNGFYEWQH